MTTPPSRPTAYVPGRRTPRRDAGLHRARSALPAERIPTVRDHLRALRVATVPRKSPARRTMVIASPSGCLIQDAKEPNVKKPLTLASPRHPRSERSDPPMRALDQQQWIRHHALVHRCRRDTRGRPTTRHPDGGQSPRRSRVRGVPTRRVGRPMRPWERREHDLRKLERAGVVVRLGHGDARCVARIDRVAGVLFHPLIGHRILLSDLGFSISIARQRAGAVTGLQAAGFPPSSRTR